MLLFVEALDFLQSPDQPGAGGLFICIPSKARRGKAKVIIAHSGGVHIVAQPSYPVERTWVCA